MGINIFPGESGGSDGFFDDKFIDPVSKFRVSNPENLIDTDFEYGLQPTKWETVEIINNTPAFFSKGGDTTIPDITGIITNAGTREITVTTAFSHGLAVGIPIRVDGTKSITADGSYIINATPSEQTFTYLCRANQPETISIFDLYTSIITGEFFQGSQISISDSAGIVTDGIGPESVLTIKTKNKHGFGLNTPFYFLNLNSTISQEFEAQNTASVSFDPTNSAVAQTFDGSNTQLQTPIDISNSASSSVFNNPIIASDDTQNTITITTNDNWSSVKVGDPIYHNVNSTSGYFLSNPKGILFIKTINTLSATTTRISLSELPNGETLTISSGVSGSVKIANLATTFPGNNINQDTQIEFNIEVGQEFLFDGGNQGYLGESLQTPPNNTLTFTNANNTITATGDSIVDYYQNAMVIYQTDGTAASGLTNNSTYFVKSFNELGGGTYSFQLSAFPDSSPISVSGGTGTQTISRIGVSTDRDIVHIPNSNFELFDMIEYFYPIIADEDQAIEGRFSANEEKLFYYVIKKYDEHNYRLDIVLGKIEPKNQSRIDINVGTPITPTEMIITGFSETYSFSITSGSLPAGLTLNTLTGVISGTPTQNTTTRDVVITLTDSNGISDSATITFQFNGRLEPATQSFTGIEAGSQSITTASNPIGYASPLTFSISSGTLPAGLSLNTSTGVISGTPTAEYAQANVTVSMVDANFATNSMSITFQISPPPPQLYAFTTATFTSGGVQGRFGPGLTESRNGLTGPETNNWKNNTAFFNVVNGIQRWTVPKTGTYRITAAGARGQNTPNCYGARMRGDFNLVEGEVLRILVGQVGVGTAAGGGTYVVRSPYTTDASAILVAGAGGFYTVIPLEESRGRTATTGGTSNGLSRATGPNGGTLGGTGTSGSGAGFRGNGNSGAGGVSFINGGTGGIGEGQGGFGGGGSRNGSWGAGAGGGWAGGAANSGDSNTRWGAGGGSINRGANQENLNGDNAGSGFVIVTFVS